MVGFVLFPVAAPLLARKPSCGEGRSIGGITRHTQSSTMRFPSALRCGMTQLGAALDKVLRKRERLFISIILMLSCLYKRIWCQVRHRPLKIRDGRRARGLLRLLLRGTGEEGPRGGVSCYCASRPRRRVPLCSPPPPFSLRLSLRIPPSLSSRGEEEAT